MIFNSESMDASNYFFKDKDQKWEPVEPKIKRQILGYDVNMMMVKVHFEKDGVGQLHSHKHTQSTYIATGVFEVTIGEKTEVLTEGDSFFVGSNISHGLICKEEGILVDVFSPMREDFIKKNY